MNLKTKEEIFDTILLVIPLGACIISVIVGLNVKPSPSWCMPTFFIGFIFSCLHTDFVNNVKKRFNLFGY